MKLFFCLVDMGPYARHQILVLPKYDCNNEIHNAISELSKEAHNVYYDEKRISEIKNEISRLYLLVV